MKISKLSIIIIGSITIALQALGRYFSSQGMGWYYGLNLPSITPPGYVFAIAWTTIYFLTALCAIIFWNYYKETINFKTIISLFALNAFFNIFWTYIFFYKHMIFPALIIAVLLELTVLALIFYIYKVSKKTSMLLLPYGAWVVFAIILSYLVWTLNK